MMVTMDTNARKHVSANFLIWMQHVTIGMDSVTVTLDIPIYTVIKVCYVFFSFGWSDFKLIIQRDMHFLSVEGLQFSFLFVIQCFLLNWSLIPATSVRKKLILVLKCILSLSPISSSNPWSCPEDCDPRSFRCDQRSNRTTSLKTSKENVL